MNHRPHTDLLPSPSSGTVTSWARTLRSNEKFGADSRFVISQSCNNESISCQLLKKVDLKLGMTVVHREI